MKIKNGLYTMYLGYELSVHQSRRDEELPISEGQKKFLIYFPTDQVCPFQDFKKSSDGSSYFKAVFLQELSSLYLIETFCTYKGFNLKVREYEPDSSIVNIETTNQDAKEKLSLITLRDSGGKDFYADQVKTEKIEKIWIERKPSSYALPFPSEIPKYEIIVSN
jgi:hypothetical protein